MKTIITLAAILTTFILIGNVYETYAEIPKEAIRFRVLANSNTDYDQSIKQEVAISVQQEISEILQGETNISKARIKLKNNLTKINTKIKDIFSKENYTLTYDINFGLNYFPQKEFKGITYNEGYYESLLITIGNGDGDNWWCVLFPPLCVLEVEESTEVEYKSLVKEVLDKYIW